MDNITNKALIIAVGIFVTIAITSGILVSINEMKDIYSKVYETDTSITSRFDEFDSYDNTTKTGIDLLNTANKYMKSSTVTVKLNNNDIKNSDLLDESIVGGNVKYNVTVEKKDPNVTIYFKKS